ncbi:hypothetical protein BDCR2A_01376 [Borrelia duttonii CR2A]|uniref:Uncharacterized protein n=2 Tax=Borrelia duttonii TaxID=40834 RepID=W6TH16_9SPIR|nr:hypothetical protein BDCR2A_01376 [Borrelia duttonii CR2A]
MNKLKKSAQCNKKNTKNYTFAILLHQLKDKLKIKVFVKLLKDSLNKQERLKYTKTFNNKFIQKGSV